MRAVLQELVQYGTLVTVRASACGVAERAVVVAWVSAWHVPCIISVTLIKVMVKEIEIEYSIYQIRNSNWASSSISIIST